MAIATTVLKAVAKEGLKAIVARQVFDKYFPKDFEEEMKSGLARVDAKLDSIAQDAAFTRVHPVRRGFLLTATYAQETFYRTLRQQATDGQLNAAVAKKLGNELLKEISKLDGNLADGKEIFGQRVDTCDFPVRFLFETLREIIAMRIAMISWAHALFLDVPDEAHKLPLLAERYVRARAEAESFAPKAAEQLVTARESFIKFKKRVEYKSAMDVDQFGNRKLDHVVGEYRDTFSSSYRGDPFLGDRIDNSVDVEWHWYDFPYRQSKELALANAFESVQRWEREHREHVAAVVKLSKQNITDPTDKFVIEVSKTVPTLTD